MSLRRVEGIEGEFRVLAATTGRLRDRLKRFYRVELNANRIREVDELSRNEKKERT